MIEQLKPCPFCGGEADIMTPEADNMRFATVMCMGCYVTGKGCEIIAKAVEAWNARAAIAAMRNDAAMDRLVAEGQRCDAMTPQEAAKVSAEDRENIVDEIESIICETHEMDVRDIDYAENIVSWLERNHPAALRAISEDSQ